MKMQKLSTKEASNVLDAWTALEVLAPQLFQKPENLAGGDAQLVSLFNKDYLPWENGGEKSLPGTRLFYQVIIGTIDFQEAMNALAEKYGESEGERPEALGESIIALVIVDQKGYVIQDDNSTVISSFAWGVPQALQGEIKNLSEWTLEEARLLEEIKPILQKKDQLENDLPLTKATIDEAYYYLVTRLGISERIVKDRKFAIKAYLPLKSEETPQGLLLNSFYLDDLKLAKSLIQDEQASENMMKYLGIKTPLTSHDILKNNKTVENIIAPENIPAGRWPGYGRHPLVLLQQAAVNLAKSELKKDGILAVNGPPGTGKTTLLRDIVASVITDRAEALLKFDDPQDAFIFTGHKIQAGNGWLKLHTLDESLKGFEILIASSNNKAVENISAELPNLKAIAGDADELRYFSSLSDALLGGNTWGLIAAVLGNSNNRHKFRQKFWWDKDVGFSTYLAEAAGIPQLIDDRDPKTNKVIGSRRPLIIEENNPPHNHADALKRWKKAKENFIKILEKSKNKLNELEKSRQIIRHLESLESELDNSKTLEVLISEHKKLKPNFIISILNFPSARKWKKKNDMLSEVSHLRQKVESLSKNLGSHLINNEFFLKTHKEINQTSPWCDPTTHALRDEVFIESLKLSKAFIDAAALPLRHNLGILMQYFCSKPGSPVSPEEEIPKSKIPRKYMPDLWSSFFLVVPTVSTTFASVSRMFSLIPPNYFGWLLIDEAGQALPQAAMGAIMRTKRAVVTGDPLQIEPVVTLPSSITENICRELEVDSDRFNAPIASTQTLADSATSYFAEFLTKSGGSRIVGFPLFVHRRCAEPMFSIANFIAYERLMVSEKVVQNSPILNCLGKSMWFDVEGSADEKWCPEEGEKVMELLHILKNAQVFPDLYIITPFKIVATNLRKMIKKSNILHSWITIDSSSWIQEHIGTVHTVQGREAEGVIMVLGAQSPDQKGARNWAGKNPNLLNVAVTRAKEVLYVIGNKNLWKGVGVFKELNDRID